MDGLLIKLLKEQGAIPFIKSNVPQTCLAIECENQIWGIGKNPWNKARTCGGSTGGEAGLISSRCSLFGYFLYKFLYKFSL